MTISGENPGNADKMGIHGIALCYHIQTNFYVEI